MKLSDIKSVFVHWSGSELINKELGNMADYSGDISKEVDPSAFNKLIKKAAALVGQGYDKTCLTVIFNDGTIYGKNGGCKFYLTPNKNSLLKLIAD